MPAAANATKDAIEITRLRRQLAEHVAQIKHLKRLVTKLQRMHFGPRSERWIDPGSVGSGVVAKPLPVPEAPPSSPVAKAPGVPRPRIRRNFPDHLSRESVFHPPETAHCPDCGGRLKPLGEDVSEILEYVPASFKVVRHIRPKLACACCDHIAQAPAPSRPIPRSFAGPALLAHVMVGKYCDHLPLYRQSGICQRSGIILNPSTLGDWIGQSHHLLTPLVDALRRYVFLAEKLHADDTPIRVLAPGEGKTRIGRLWTYVRDDRPAGTTDPAAVWLAYSANRKGEHPQAHLKSYQGILQADAYAGYNLVYEQGVQEAACWAHYLESVFIWSGWPTTQVSRSGGLSVAERSAEQTPHNSGRQPDGKQRVGGWRCRYRCGRSRLPKHTSPPASGAMPVCPHVRCIRPAAVHLPAMEVMRA